MLCPDCKSFGLDTEMEKKETHSDPDPVAEATHKVLIWECPNCGCVEEREDEGSVTIETDDDA